jgi:putative SOS response-associated peptidase YedK
MAFAGLWSVWTNSDTGEKLATCCLLTTKPNELVKPFHDRMPVILRLDDYSTWLNHETPIADLKALLKSYPAHLMETWPVRPAVNKPTVEGPQLVKPLDAA